MNDPLTIIMAYVDPGSAGFIIVSVLGFLAAAGYTVRAYLGRLRGASFPRRPRCRERQSPDEGSDSDDDANHQS